MPMTYYPGANSEEEPAEPVGGDATFDIDYGRERAYDRVFELLELMEATDVLRAHVSPARRYLVDQLESAMRMLQSEERDCMRVEKQIIDPETDPPAPGKRLNKQALHPRGDVKRRSRSNASCNSDVTRPR